MVELSGTYGDKSHTPHGVIGQIDDGVSNEEAPVRKPSLRTWDRGTRPAAKEGKRPNYIIGPNGDVVTVADLPSPGTTRWVIRRKAEVVLAVNAGLLSLDEACARYRLTAEEFTSWQTAIERHGLLALRTTQLQQYRHGEGEPGSAKEWHAPRPSEVDRFVFTADDVA
jgi:hypothetical protein